MLHRLDSKWILRKGFPLRGASIQRAWRDAGNGRTRPVFMCRLLFATEISRGFGNRSYVSGLLIGARAVALMGLRTLLGLINGKVLDDHKGRQNLGAFFLQTMQSSLSRTPFDLGKRQMASMAISLRASNWVPRRRTSSWEARAKAHRRKTSCILARGSMPI
jgi:hypothetical protein